MKFKKGDRVRVIDAGATSLRNGDEGTVVNNPGLNNETLIRVDFDRASSSSVVVWYKDRFELIPEQVVLTDEELAAAYRCARANSLMLNDQLTARGYSIRVKKTGSLLFTGDGPEVTITKSEVITKEI